MGRAGRRRLLPFQYQRLLGWHGTNNCQYLSDFTLLGGKTEELLGRKDPDWLQMEVDYIIAPYPGKYPRLSL